MTKTTKVETEAEAPEVETEAEAEAPELDETELETEAEAPELDETELETEAEAPELDETELETGARQLARAAELEAANALTDDELVAARSADTDKLSTDEHVKIFVLEPGPKPTEANGFDHGPNKAAVVQYMIAQGLRPTGEVRHVSTEKIGHAAMPSWAVKYAVLAVPAERYDFAAEEPTA